MTLSMLVLPDRQMIYGKAAALFKGPGFPLGFRVACGEATVTGSRDD